MDMKKRETFGVKPLSSSFMGKSLLKENRSKRTLVRLIQIQMKWKIWQLKPFYSFSLNFNQTNRPLERIVFFFKEKISDVLIFKMYSKGHVLALISRASKRKRALNKPSRESKQTNPYPGPRIPQKAEAYEVKTWFKHPKSALEMGFAWSRAWPQTSQVDKKLVPLECSNEVASRALNLNFQEDREGSKIAPWMWLFSVEFEEKLRTMRQPEWCLRQQKKIAMLHRMLLEAAPSSKDNQLRTHQPYKGEDFGEPASN